ncbi:MAG: ABC transporter permease subunit [Candidatus Thermoplasmatota archaeon]|nr:ABC transporter permease subunit [Candidatus Thermoplasmatota archaeon]
MGISPIEYHPWKGERIALNLRFYVIARSILRHKIRSAGVLVLLILGFLLAHTLYLIMFILSPHERLEPTDMSSYLGSGMFTVFAMLLAAVVTSDLISEDLASNSFVLYFARALKVRDYIMGKAVGALLVMSLLCLFPPILVAIVSMVTQTGDDYVYSLGVLCKTALIGALVTVFFVPFGLMVSCFTKRKSYAAVGTFMSFFVLAIVAGIFSQFSNAWTIVSPIDSLAILFRWFLEGKIPTYVDEVALVLIITFLMVVPAAVVYYRLTRQVIGK